ncbi:MAG: hypothetical protein GEV07_25900 [Streptosporangiales bacterium]|nr:hypothetical protein [Streptosporangiales bacterium]
MTTYDCHHPTGQDHAQVAARILDSVARRLADPDAVTAAQVHATLPVADALTDVSQMLDHLHVIALTRKDAP